MKAAAALLFFCSGACGLVYEIVWTRWMGLIVGTFAASTATVLAVFMAGLAAGSWIVGRRAARLPPAGAMRLYALLEAGVAAWAALSPLAFAAGSRAYTFLLGASPEPLVRAALSGALLLPATVAMGGTLPAMARAVRALAPGPLGALYAVNTIGAACGPLLAAFLLIPHAGLARTALAAAALNATVAAGAFLLSRRLPGDAPDENGPAAAGQAPAPSPAAPALVLGLAAAAGFVSLALEVALARRFVMTVTGNTVYALALILSGFLAGIALGGILVRRFPPPDAASALRRFAGAMAVIFAYVLLTPFWDSLPLALAPRWARADAFAVRTALNAATILLLLLPVTAFGYALPALFGALDRRGADAVGRLFAANTLGAAAGASAAGFLLIPLLGLDVVLPVLGGLALTAGSAAALGTVAARRRPVLLAATAVLLLLLPLCPRPDPAVMNSGLYNRASMFVLPRGMTLREAVHQLGRVAWQRDGATGRIAVREMGARDLSFIVNGKPDGSSTEQDLLTEIGSAQLAAFCHPRPRTVLLIGLGTGISAGTLLAHPGIDEVHVVEIEPLVLEVARRFAAWNRHALDDPRLRVHIDDARRFLLTDARRWDLIVAEPSNLWVSGMVNLYTAEALDLARRRLAPGGIMLQWLNYYQVSEDDLRGALATFQSVFPNTTFWMHHAGDSFMAGSEEPLLLDPGEWERRWKAPGPSADLARAGIRGPSALMSFYRLGPREIARAVRGARICRDDDPFLEFTTPLVPWDPVTTEHRRMFLKRLEVSEPVPLARETAELRLRLGRAFIGAGDLSRARLEFRRALEVDPGSAAASNELRKIAGYYREEPVRR